MHEATLDSIPFPATDIANPELLNPRPGEVNAASSMALWRWGPVDRSVAAAAFSWAQAECWTTTRTPNCKANALKPGLAASPNAQTDHGGAAEVGDYRRSSWRTPVVKGVVGVVPMSDVCVGPSMRSAKEREKHRLH